MAAPALTALLGAHAAPAASWTPASLTDLRFWYDFSDTGSITSASNLISQINDLSGLGNHATQSAGGNKPSTGLNTINGLNAGTFTGSSPTFLDATHASASVGATYAVLQLNTNTNYKVLYDSQSGGRWAFYRDNVTTQWDSFAGAELTGGSPDTSLHFVIVVNDTTSSAIYVDGSSVASGNAGSNSATTFRLGTDVAGSGAGWDGLVGAIWRDGVVPSSGVRASALAYAQAKWGTP